VSLFGGGKRLGRKASAVLQYTSWWDGSGMKFKMGGMDPTKVSNFAFLGIPKIKVPPK